MHCICFLFSLYTAMFHLLRVITVTDSFFKIMKMNNLLKWCEPHSFTNIFQYFPYTLRVPAVSDHSDTSANSRFCYHVSGYQITLPWIILYWRQDFCFSPIPDKLGRDEESSTNGKVLDDNDWLCNFSVKSFTVEKKSLIYQSCLKISKTNALLTIIPETSIQYRLWML